jgi:hypothetical protein
LLTKFSVVASGIARTIYLGRAQAEPYDKSWAGYTVFIASIAECNVAIACACAPSLKSVFGRFFRDMSTKYGSSENSKLSSNNDNINNNPNNLDSFPSSNGLTSVDWPMDTLKRTTSKLKARLGADKKDALEMKEESSFREAHEQGLDDLEPVASGLGDGLVSPMEREFSRIMHTRDSQTADEEEGIQPIPLTSHNIRNMPGPGSYIISPSPSVSSSEASLVNKQPYSRDGGLPYDFSERGSHRPSSPWSHTTTPTPRSPPQFHKPLPPRGASSHVSEKSFYDDHIRRPSTAGSTSDFEPRRKVRRKLSREKWTENK